MKFCECGREISGRRRKCDMCKQIGQIRRDIRRKSAKGYKAWVRAYRSQPEVLARERQRVKERYWRCRDVLLARRKARRLERALERHLLQEK